MLIGLRVSVEDQGRHTLEGAVEDVVVSGECSICMSHGKKIGIFELDVRCKWSGKRLPDGDGIEHGELRIPHLFSEDVEHDEYEIKVTGDGPVATLMRDQGRRSVRTKIKEFYRQLLEAKSGDGRIRREEREKARAETVKTVLLKKTGTSSVRSTKNNEVEKSASDNKVVGPARSIQVTVHVSDIDEGKVKSEHYRFFQDRTYLFTDTVEAVKEAATASIVEQGWKSTMFPSVVLVGPMRFDGKPRQIAVLGSHKRFKRGTYLPNRRSFGKSLSVLQGNTLRVSPLDPVDALEAARDAAAEEERLYESKKASRAKRREDRQKRREEAKRSAEEARAKEAKEEKIAAPSSKAMYRWDTSILEDEEEHIDSVPSARSPYRNISDGPLIEILDDADADNEFTDETNSEAFGTLQLE